MRFIPNENSWVGFTTVQPAVLAAPTLAEIAAASKLTGYLVQLNASASGNAIPTPDLEHLFESSIVGTSTGQFSADFYRDDGVNNADGADYAWSKLPRRTVGWFFISRFGGSGTHHDPITGESVEVWPVAVTSRVAANMQSNQPQTFTVTGAVPAEPAEDAVVASGTAGVPTAPRALVGVAGGSGAVDLAWEPPLYIPAGTVTYAIKRYATMANALARTSPTVVTPASSTPISAVLAGEATGNAYYTVTATGTGGAGPASNVATVVVT